MQISCSPLSLSLSHARGRFGENERRDGDWYWPQNIFSRENPLIIRFICISNLKRQTSKHHNLKGQTSKLQHGYTNTLDMLTKIFIHRSIVVGIIGYLKLVMIQNFFFFPRIAYCIMFTRTIQVLYRAIRFWSESPQNLPYRSLTQMKEKGRQALINPLFA